MANAPLPSRWAGAMQFLKATETKIELQENQRSDQILAIRKREAFSHGYMDRYVSYY